jgi:midasin
LQLDLKIFENDKASLIQYEEARFIENDQAIGVEPFVMEKKVSDMVTFNTYAFDAYTTKINLLKVLRAYQLNKPIIIEGPPGVGKTSLVENLAKVSGRKLIRVNLSEQTDMMDLLGSEYPVSSNTQDGDDDIRFHWCDGVLL